MPLAKLSSESSSPGRRSRYWMSSTCTSVMCVARIFSMINVFAVQIPFTFSMSRAENFL